MHPTTKQILTVLLWALRRPPQTIFNIAFGHPKALTQGTSPMPDTPQGTNIGTFTAPPGDKSVNFNAAIVPGTGDATAPKVTLLNGAAGTVLISPLDPTSTFYPVTVSGMAPDSTNIIQIAGDNVDDCYLTVIIGPKESFTVDPATVTFSS